LFENVVGFFDQPLHGLADFGFRFHVQFFEYLLKAFYLLLGFLEMLLDRVFEFGRRGFFGDLGKRPDQLFFGVVDVLDFVDQKVSHRFDFLHGNSCARC